MAKKLLVLSLLASVIVFAGCEDKQPKEDANTGTVVEANNEVSLTAEEEDALANAIAEEAGDEINAALEAWASEEDVENAIAEGIVEGMNE